MSQEPPRTPPPGEVRDHRGRRYTVGPPAREVAGLPRSAILVRALVCVAAIGALQFGYGAAVPALAEAHGWSAAQALTPFLVWALVQGSLARAPHWLARRGLLGPGAAICAGALLCGTALLLLGHSADPAVAALGYGLLGGAGAGLVYHSCADLVAGWFPDRNTVRLGVVGGAFALGAVPVLPALALDPSPAALPTAATLLALVVVLLGLAGGVGQRAAPRRWWPPGNDPRVSAPRRRADPPPAKDFSVGQAWSSGRSLPALHAVVALSGTCVLFTLAVVPTLLLELGRSSADVAAVVTALALASGLGRLAASASAERAGSRRVLSLLMAATALGLAGLAAALPTGPSALLVALALLVGAGTGSCYPLTRAITEGHFGTEHAPALQGLVYGSKAVGGLLGVGGAMATLSLVPAAASVPVLAAAGLLPAAAAVLAARLRRPLPVRTLPGHDGVWTATRHRAPM